MELRELAVVTLVQDDADHAIWHAVQIPVKSETPGTQVMAGPLGNRERPGPSTLLRTG